MLLPSFVVSIFRNQAHAIRRAANWDRGHMHEAGTTQEWEARRDANNARDHEANVWDYAAEHTKAMFERDFS